MKTRNLIATTLALLLIFSCTLISASASGISGSCGTNATWSYNEQTGSLVISGFGSIDNYEQLTVINGTLGRAEPAPWKQYANRIRSITIGEGITSIGESAFKYCDNLKNLTLPSTLTRIENYAFARCGALDRIVIPASVQYIGCNAFLGRYEETKPYIYFLGNAPSAKSANGTGRSFSSNTTLYHISSTSGWGSSIWNGYQTKTWNGSDFLDPLFSGTPGSTPDAGGWENNVWTPSQEPSWTLDISNDYGTKVNVSGTKCYSYAYSVVDAVNKLRADQGLPTLIIDDKLMMTAMQRAAECSVYYSHNRPNDTSCLEIFPSATVRGENIAAGQSSPAAVMSDWTNSSGHYANMVNSDYTSIGVGCFYIDGTYYWVQSFTSGQPTTHIKSENTKSIVSVPVSSNHFILRPNNQSIKVKVGETVQIPIQLVNTGHNNSLTTIQAKISDYSSPLIVALSKQSLTVTGKQPGTDFLTIKFENGIRTSYNIIVSSPYSDVSESNWYYEAVNWTTNSSLIDSASPSAFGASLPMSRGMTAELLYRLEGSPIPSWTLLFSDVNSDYAASVNWTASCGLMSGYGNNRFGPDDNLTREQMATILYRYAQYKGIHTTERADISRYSDSVDVSGYALDAMRWANNEGLVTGTSSFTLSPTKNVTKAEAASIFMRFCEKFNIK